MPSTVSTRRRHSWLLAAWHADALARAVRERGADGVRIAQPLFDVVVVSYNNRETLRRCVDALSGEEGVSVTVVDNASTDKSLSTIQDLRVRRMPLDQNVGFACGCNAGWREGSAPYVLFLNPDARLEIDDLQCLGRALEETGAAIAAPRIHREDGTLDWSLRRFPRLRSVFGQALFAHRFRPSAEWVDEVIRDPVTYESTHTCDWASGACLLVRRELLEALGGFDETFFMYSEDVDLCRRSWDLGRAVVYTPDALCVHAGGASAPRSELIPVLMQSRVRYARKHFGRGAALAYRLGLVLLAVTHVLVSRSLRSRIGYARGLVTAIRS